MVIMLKNVKFLTFAFALVLFAGLSLVSCKEKAAEEEAVEAVEAVEEAPVEEVVDTAAAAVEEAAPVEEAAK